MIRSLFCHDSLCVFFLCLFANLSYFLSFPASMAFLLERMRQFDLTSRLRRMPLSSLGSRGTPRCQALFWGLSPRRFPLRPSFCNSTPSNSSVLELGWNSPALFARFFPLTSPSEPCLARFPYFGRPPATEPSFPSAPVAASVPAFVHRPSALPEEILPDRPAEPLVVLVLPDEPRILPRPWYLESEVDHEGSSIDDSLAIYDDMSESSGDSNLAVCRANRP